MKIRPFSILDSKTQGEPALDQKQVVQAALELLDEAGFDNLTMRRLGSKLGIKAASLYWHVKNKQELLGLLAEEICAPMAEPDRALPWRAQLEFVANEYRKVLLAHRNAAQVLTNSGVPSGVNRLRLAEIVLRTLLDAGFDPKDAAYGGFLLNDYVTTFVAEETQFAGTDDTELSSEDAARSVQNWIGALPLTTYPSVIALADYLVQPEANERFRFGLEILHAGLAIRLAGKKS